MSTVADVVELREVTRRFGPILAVDAVSLKIKQGEFFSLLGPSGCGKTTTLRLIGGFEYPTSGRVFLQGMDVTEVPPYRRATNMVFQQLALFPHLDVFENVAFGLRLRRTSSGDTVRRVGRVLELVDLPGFERRLIHQLSGGQKQRVAIARALVNEPAVLLLDEPLGSLDLKLRLAMQTELKALQDRVGTTFIYVTHDQSEALTMSDRIAVMRDGRVEQLGTSTEIYGRPRTRFVATFIGEANLMQGEVAGRERNRLLVRVSGLTIRAPLDLPLSPGSQVTLSVRPEHVKIGAPAEACENRWPALVRDVVFMGSVVRCRLALNGDQSTPTSTDAKTVTVTAELHNDEVEGLAQGAAVTAGWPGARTVVLQE